MVFIFYLFIKYIIKFLLDHRNKCGVHFLLVCTFYFLTLSRVQMVQLVGAYKTVINSFSCLQLFNRFSERNEEIIQVRSLIGLIVKLKLLTEEASYTFYARASVYIFNHGTCNKLKIINSIFKKWSYNIFKQNWLLN